MCILVLLGDCPLNKYSRFFREAIVPVVCSLAVGSGRFSYDKVPKVHRVLNRLYVNANDEDLHVKLDPKDLVQVQKIRDHAIRLHKALLKVVNKEKHRDDSFAENIANLHGFIALYLPQRKLAYPGCLLAGLGCLYYEYSVLCRREKFFLLIYIHME